MCYEYFSLEDRNYYNDARVRARDRWYNQFNPDKMTATYNWYKETNDEDDGEEVTVPCKYAVCPTCNGKGTHVNPSIDCNGLTASDFEDDPGFMEDYFSGVYNETCYGCGGRNVVPIPDIDRFPSKFEKLAAKFQAQFTY